MIDYYRLLGLEKYRNETEDKLIKEIDSKMWDCSIKSNNYITQKSRKFLYHFYSNFKTTLENYGSKANYDRALSSNKLVGLTVKVNKETLKRIS